MKNCVIPATLVAFAASSALAQDELWRQDPIGSCGGLSSQDARNNNGLGWFSEVVDNYEAQGGDAVGSMMFWGGYCSPEDGRGNTEGFTVRVYTDDNGSPGTRIYEQDVFAFTEEPFAMLGDLIGYEYTIDLPVAFEAPNDGQFWIGVVAILARGGGAEEPQWGWVQAAAFNAPGANQWFFDPGNFNEQNNDVSFALFAADAGCPADLDGDDDTDADDFFAYLDAFANDDQSICDIDTDGDCDADDFFAYLDLFAQGC